MPAPWLVVHVHAVDLLTIAQVTTAVRGLVRPLAACYAGLTLRMLAPWPVHSACWTHLLAQVPAAVR